MSMQSTEKYIPTSVGHSPPDDIEDDRTTLPGNFPARPVFGLAGNPAASFAHGLNYRTPLPARHGAGR